MPQKSERELSFEEALEKLEQIVKNLENEELALDNSLKIFEEGIKLSRLCSQKLDRAERRIEILLGENGRKEPVPFKSE